MEITSKELKEKIKNGEKVMVDFHAKWCSPCRSMKPGFEKISEQLKNDSSLVQLYTMDIENDMDYIRELGVRSVPTIKGFSDGKEVFSEVGLKQTDYILEMVDKLK
jgi:thioredoxin 1